MCCRSRACQLTGKFQGWVGVQVVVERVQRQEMETVRVCQLAMPELVKEMEMVWEKAMGFEVVEVAAQLSAMHHAVLRSGR